MGTTKNNHKIKLIGSTNGHQSGNVYSDDGLSPALCRVDYKNPITIITGGGEFESN